MGETSPDNLAFWAVAPSFLPPWVLFSKRHSLCNQKPLPIPLSGCVTPSAGPTDSYGLSLGQEAFCSPVSEPWTITQPDKLWRVQKEKIFLMHHMATILAVCACVEQLNIVGFLYLLVPFLYPVLEKTFYSFLVQKKLGPLCSSAVFNYVTPPTPCFSGHPFTRWRIYTAALCSFPATVVTLPPHT